MNPLTTLESSVNNLIVCGRPAEAFERFYHNDVVMQENTSKATKGKEANRRREERFDGVVSEMRAELLASAVSDDVSFPEWVYDILLRNGVRWKITETAVRRWKDGKIVLLP